MRKLATILAVAILFQAGAALAQIDLETAKEHWAYRPLQSAAVPAVKDHRWPRGEIDRFLLAKMDAAGLRPVSDATPLILIRRATYDLTGLPAKPHELDNFLAAVKADGREKAFRALVERLLASPAYGERWGRHWLDVVRYADTSGSSSDHPVPEAQRYRDYVIAAFNKDKPFDRFVREQVAGDLLEHSDDAERRECIIATGYLAGARRFGVSGKEMPLTIEDTITNLGEALLATSVQCARCHDHTHDAVPATDYYALYGIFSSTRYPFPGAENQKTPTGLVPLSIADIDGRDELEAYLTMANVELSALKRTARNGGLKENQREESRRLNRNIERARAKLAEPADFAYAVGDLDRAGDAALYQGAEAPADTEEHLVPRGFLQLLGGQTLPEDHEGSGRLELAGWLTSEDNPLFARVIVNRIWGWHFGRPIVDSPNDFGTLGAKPDHPQLLDHLARRFIDGGYSIKDLHRQIMASRVYSLSSDALTANHVLDPESVSRWRFDRRRLSAEEIRDAMLAASGQLQPGPAPPHPFPPQDKWRFTQHSPFYANYDHDHRSIYLMQQRIRRHPVLSVFDSADTNASTPEREENTAPVASLFLLNAPFAHRAADYLAARVLTDHHDLPGQIDFAHRLLFGHEALEEDIKLGQSYVAKCRAELSDLDPLEAEASALSSYMRILFCSNEFVYID